MKGYCYFCHVELPDDPARVHVGIDADAMDRAGLNDVSEIINEKVIIQMCEVCGTRAQARTVAEIKASEPKKPIQ